MLNINANVIKNLRNKERFANSCKATIITRVIIIVVNCLKDIFFY